LFLPNPFARLTPTAVIDILLVALIVYQLLLIIRGRRSAHIATGLVVLVGVYLIARWAQLQLLRSMLETLAPYTAFALIVMFQSDLRRMLARIGQRGWLGAQLQLRETFEELVLAVEQLSLEKTGALIIIEQEIGLRSFIESGVPLDAEVSRDLILSIFQKNSTLHDGAAILQRDRVAAAACFLPLTMNPVSRVLGTRHRAGIGITEEADCLSLIVSEETGQLSVASGGDIETNITPDQLRARLAQAFGLRPRAGRSRSVKKSGRLAEAGES
jgi:diadenylate cyclase